MVITTKRCKVGICEWVLPFRGPEAIFYAAKLGFDGIQIEERGGFSAGYPLLQKELQQQYTETASHCGIRLQTLHLWSLCREAGMIHPLDSPAGKAALQSLQAGVDTCAAMGIEKLMVTSGFLCQIKSRQDFDRFASMLKAACRMGEEKGVTIVFESVLTSSELHEMIHIVGKSLKICYDIFNPIRFSTGDPLTEIKELGLPAIDHFHLKDGPENLIGCVPLGEGAGRFDRVAQMIRALGYTGWLVSENYYWDPPMKQPPTALVERDLSTIKRFFD